MQASEMLLFPLKDLVAVCSDVVSTLAILIGGYLAYRKWFREAPHFSRGDLSHEVNHFLLSDSKRLVHVAVTIRNAGTVTLRPSEGYTLLQQVVPVQGDHAENLLAGKGPMGVTRTEFAWPTIERREYPMAEDQLRVDSGETEKLHCEFVIPASVRAVFVYSMVALDQKDQNLGWDATTFCDFDRPPCS